MWGGRAPWPHKEGISSVRASRNNPQLVPEFIHTVLYLDSGTARSFRDFCAFPVSQLRVISAQRRGLRVPSDHSLTAQPGSWVCVKRYFFPLYENWHWKNPNRPVQSFLGSFGAKLTSKDQRFQDGRNVSSHPHISYWESQRVLRCYVVCGYTNVLSLKFLCPARTQLQFPLDPIHPGHGWKLRTQRL